MGYRPFGWEWLTAKCTPLLTCFLAKFGRSTSNCTSVAKEKRGKIGSIASRLSRSLKVTETDMIWLFGIKQHTQYKQAVSAIGI